MIFYKIAYSYIYNTIEHMESNNNENTQGIPTSADGSILSKLVITDGAAIIQKTAEQVVEHANLNEAIRIIEKLEKEVGEMVMPVRFSREKVVSSSPYSINTNPELKGLTEDEYKRQQLLMNLISLKHSILINISGLKDLVSDIEATKLEG
jgi:hypothetical protein